MSRYTLSKFNQAHAKQAEEFDTDSMLIDFITFAQQHPELNTFDLLVDSFLNWWIS